MIFCNYGSKWGPFRDPCFSEIGPLGSKMAARRFNTGTFCPQREAQDLKKCTLGGTKNDAENNVKKQWILRPSTLGNGALVQARCAFCKKEMFWKRSQKGAKMEPKCMPNLTTGGHGPPKERPGGDFDSFWCASRAAPCPKKGVPKTSIKIVPQQIIKNRFGRARGGPGRLTLRNARWQRGGKEG